MRYEYKYFNVPILHKYNATEILKGKRLVSLDLGLSKEEVEIRKSCVVIRDVEVEKRILEKIARDNGTNIFFVFEDGVKKALFFEGAVYKLRLVSPATAPTLEINGIHMHRIKRITPWEDARRKVEEVEVFKGARVLDICTGLGYTAIHSINAGACEVVSVEKDKNVLEMAEYNPWSRELEDERIKIFLDDAVEFVKGLEDSSFDIVINDPPRESLARLLYSRPFFKELLRVLRRGGRLIQYCGNPQKRSRNLMEEVKKRLEDVGFKVRKEVGDIECLVAVKD